MGDLTVGFSTTARLDEVWGYFTDPELLSSWHGHAETFEAWPSGEVRFANDDRDPVEGIVEVVVPYSRIEWIAPADSSRIIETFAAGDDGTEVRIQQVGLASDWPADGLAGRVRGWEESIADLVLILDHGVRAARHMLARADLGMRTAEVPAGLRVEDVDVDGPTDSASIRHGDILLTIDHVPVYRKSDIRILMRGHLAGDAVEVRFVRGREIESADVTLG